MNRYKCFKRNTQNLAFSASSVLMPISSICVSFKMEYCSLPKDTPDLVTEQASPLLSEKISKISLRRDLWIKIAKDAFELKTCVLGSQQPLIHPSCHPDICVLKTSSSSPLLQRVQQESRS